MGLATNQARTDWLAWRGYTRRRLTPRRSADGWRIRLPRPRRDFTGRQREEFPGEALVNPRTAAPNSNPTPGWLSGQGCADGRAADSFHLVSHRSLPLGGHRGIGAPTARPHRSLRRRRMRTCGAPSVVVDRGGHVRARPLAPTPYMAGIGTAKDGRVPTPETLGACSDGIRRPPSTTTRGSKRVACRALLPACREPALSRSCRPRPRPRPGSSREGLRARARGPAGRARADSP